MKLERLLEILLGLSFLILIFLSVLYIIVSRNLFIIVVVFVAIFTGIILGLLSYPIMSRKYSPLKDHFKTKKFQAILSPEEKKIAKARELVRKGEYFDAKEITDKVISVDRNNFEAYFILFQIHNRYIRNPEKATETLIKLLDIARIKRKDDKFIELYEEYNIYLENERLPEDIHYKLCLLLEEKNRYKVALEQFHLFIKNYTNSKYNPVLLFKGAKILLTKLEKPKDAMIWLEEILKNHSNITWIDRVKKYYNNIKTQYK